MRHKKWFFTLILTGFLLVPCIAGAVATKVHPYECKTCHTADIFQAGLGNPLANNVCITCHNPADGNTPHFTGTYPAPLDGQVEGVFSIADASNKYNSGITGTGAAADQTSHNWGAAIYNPAAGASSPTDPTMQSRYGASSGFVTCTRCHDPHGNIYDPDQGRNNPKLFYTGSVDDKYTGYPGSLVDAGWQTEAAEYNKKRANAMCVDCHKAFASPADGHGFGSHFTGSYGMDADPGYKTTAAIQAAASELKLIDTDYDGNLEVACVTCHGTHNTDSDATSTDGVRGNMVAGADGNLLRGDGAQFVNDASRSTSLCNTCHNFESMGVHGSGPNAIGCLGCHGGHNYNDGNPSYYMLINGYTTLPSGATEEEQRAANWGGTQAGVKDGLCETCHGNIEDNFPELTSVGQDHTAGFTNCTQCHLGHTDDGGFSKPVGCTGCHGYAPSIDARGDLNEGGFAFSTATTNRYNTSGVFKDESLTPHATHANGNGKYDYSCSVCHGNKAGDTSLPNHDGGSFQEVLDASVGVLPSITNSAGMLTPTYTATGAGTCNAVYCHSNGGANDGFGNRDFSPVAGNTDKIPAPQWQDTKTTIYNAIGDARCGACHGNDSGEMASTTHDAHLDAGYSCNTCHIETATDNVTLKTTAIGTTHVNGSVNVVFDTGSALKPTGSTVTHGSNPYSDAVTMTCSVVYCHSNGKSTDAPADRVYNSVTWTESLPASGTAARCASCHDITSGTDQSAAHAAHVNGSSSKVGRDLDCATCHDLTMDAGDNVNLGTDGLQYHVNGEVDIQLPAGIDTSQDCSTNLCHSDGNLGGTITNKFQPWTSAPLSLGCADCHGDGTTAEPSYADGGAGTGDSNSHGAHVGSSNISCEECHNDTSVDGTALKASAPHVDQAIDVAFKQGGSYSGAADNTDTCSTTYCHGNGAPQWGGDVNCGDCHAANNTLGGAHSGHWQDVATGTLSPESNLSNSTTYKINCGVCHAGSQGVSHATGWAAAGEYTGEVLFNSVAAPVVNGLPTTYNNGASFSADGAFAYSDATCANLYCHGNFDDAPFGSNGNNATPQWNSVSSGDCGTCHDVDTSTTMDGGAHGTHASTSGTLQLGCDVCHGGTAASASGGILDKTLHVNQVLNIDLKDGEPRVGVAATYNAASTGGSASNTGSIPAADVGKSANYGSCDTIYCHSTVQGSPDPTVAPTYMQPDWGGGVNCGDCHKAGDGSTLAAQDTGSHLKHVSASSYGFSCATCHDGAGSPTTKHANYAIDIDFKTGLPGVSAAYNGATTEAKVPGTAYQDCSSVYCHSNGYLTDLVYNTVSWGNASDGACGSCHGTTADNPPSSPTHDKHVGSSSSYQFACATCHESVVTTTANATEQPAIRTLAEHVADLGKDVVFNSTTVGSATYTAADQTCATTYCHSSGQSADGTSTTPYNTATPDWGVAGSGACGTCHKVTEATGLTTGSHAAHLGTFGVNGCGDCHTGAADDASSYASTNHVNRLIDVANSYNMAAAPGNGYGRCSTATCHDDGTGTPGLTPYWGTAGDCDTCHTSSNMTTGSHDNHLNTSLRSTLSCSNCHDNADPSSGTAPSMHLNGNVNVYNSVNDFGGTQTVTDLGYTYNTLKQADGSAAFDSCSTSYCHGDTLKFSTEDMNDGLYNVTVAPTWGANISDGTCDFCHGFPPVGDSGSGAQHPTSDDCSACHFHINEADDGFDDAAALTKHIDGIVQVDGGNNCTDCHGADKYKDPETTDPDHGSHTDVQFFLTGKTLPGGDYGGAEWYDVYYNASGRLIVGCGQCHPDTQPSHPSGGAVEVDLVDASAPVKMLNSSPTYSSNQCNNVYCHSDGVGNFKTSPTWDATADNAGVTCASCHGNAPSTGAHSEHEVGIHYTELYNGAGGLGLMTAAADPLVDDSAAHGNSSTSDPISCQVCHNDTVKDDFNATQTIGGVANTGCSDCHTAGGGNPGDSEVGIAANTTAHLNGTKNVAILLSSFKSRAQLRDDIDTVNVGTYWNRTNGYKNSAALSFDIAQGIPSYNSTDATCSTTACHNGIETPAWNSGSSGDCMACHTELPR